MLPPRPEPGPCVLRHAHILGAGARDQAQDDEDERQCPGTPWPPRALPAPRPVSPLHSRLQPWSSPRSQHTVSLRLQSGTPARGCFTPRDSCPEAWARHWVAGTRTLAVSTLEPHRRLLPRGLSGLARPSQRAAPLLPLSRFSVRGQRWHRPQVALPLRSLPLVLYSK